MVCQSTAPESTVCACMFVCVISNQITSKKRHYVSDLLHKTHIKVLLVLWYQRLTCRSILSLSKVAYVVWSPIQSKKQDNRKNRAVGVRGDKEVRGGWQHLKKRVEVGNIGGKTNPPIPGVPPFLIKIFQLPPPITAIFGKFHLSLYENGGLNSNIVL